VSADEWFKTATQRSGSWWEDWQAWIAAQNENVKVPARTPKNALEDAPGSYVMLRLGKPAPNVR
jgi:polyhydroxyalkanoate synthase